MPRRWKPCSRTSRRCASSRPCSPSRPTDSPVPPASPARCALVAQGSAPAVAAIEAAAQTAALWEATRRRREGGAAAPRLGYLVGLRDVTFFAQRIPAEASFLATVRLEAATLPLAHYAMQIDLGSTPVLRGTLATFLTDETMPA